VTRKNKTYVILLESRLEGGE
jgi:hypothetical protein